MVQIVGVQFYGHIGPSSQCEIIFIVVEYKFILLDSMDFFNEFKNNFLNS